MLRGIIHKIIDPFLLRAAERMESLTGSENFRYAMRYATADPNAKIHRSALIRNFLGDPNAIKIGAHTDIRGELTVLWDGGGISFGEHSVLAEESRIVSEASVSIGNRVLISGFVDIHDTNGHPTDWRERRQDIQAIMKGKFEERLPAKTIFKPIIIEDDVWIGMNSTILKGARIGRGAIVAAGSVVVGDVPAWTIAAGNPAKVIGEL